MLSPTTNLGKGFCTVDPDFWGWPFWLFRTYLAFIPWFISYQFSILAELHSGPVLVLLQSWPMKRIDNRGTSGQHSLFEPSSFCAVEWLSCSSVICKWEDRNHFVGNGFKWATEKKKKLLLSIESWLLSRDPYFMVDEMIPIKLRRISSNPKRTKQLPGDSIRDLFIPDRWRSRFTV